MKHYLLTLPIAFLATTVSMAQTAPETALTAQEGTNKYTVEGESSQTVYWKFTADKNYIACTSPLEGSYNTPTVGTEFTTNEYGQQLVGLRSAGIKYPQVAYPLKKGTTYYFASTNLGDTGFQLQLIENNNIDGGMSAGSPAELADGQMTYLGDPYSTSYNNYNVYAAYTATEDGLLTLSSAAYLTATVNGTSYTSSYDSGNNVFSFGVESGKTYNVSISTYQPIIVSTSISHPTKGSIEMPFEGNDGANTVPADADTYYYTYTPQTSGYLTISSNDEIPGGSVKIYSSKSDAEPVAVSEQGTFNVRTEVKYPGNTYYIAVDKIDFTDEPETFNIAMEAYKPGELESNPIVIGQLPSTQTLEAATGTYYYSVSVPAGTEKFLTVTALGNVDSNTTLSVYPTGNSWSGVNGNGSVELNVSNSYDTNYTIKWTANEPKPLSFTVAYKDIEPGDVITSPIEAVSGENRIKSDGTKYYSYTATRSGKLAIELGSPEMSVAFPRGTGAYDGNYEPIVNGITYSLEAQSGTTYLIAISNAKQGETFYLSESDFQQGEVRNMPIEVEGNEFTIGKNQNNCWIKYTAKEDCQVTIDCDAPYYDNGSSMVYFGKENEYMTGMTATRQNGSDYDTYFHGTKVLNAGESLLVHLQLIGNVEGNRVTFTEGEMPAGMSALKPFEISVGESVDVKTNNTVWVKANVTKGENVFVANQAMRTIIYTSLEDAKNETNGEFVNYDSSYDENWNITCTLRKNFDADATIYFQIFGTYSDASFTFQSNGTATAINGISGAATAKTEVFNLNGVKVANSTEGLEDGVYVVRQNGKAKKVVIRK